MPKLTLVIALFLSACAPLPKLSDNKLERLAHLGMPLESEEGQAKLAVLHHLSDELVKDSSMVRFVH
jgi:hypothetical protein